MRNKDVDNSMADAIRRAFAESGLSIKRLAIDAGIPYASAYNLMHKNTDPTLSTAALVCGVLELELRPAKKTKKAK